QVWLLMTSPTNVTVTVPVAQLSTAVTLVGSGAGTSSSHSTVMLAGQVTVGATLSNTVIVWAQVEELPQASVAIYVRININWFTQIWLVITSPPCVMTTSPIRQLSVAVTAVTSGSGTSSAHVTVRLAGHVTSGATSSNTVIVWAQVAVLPHSSVAI